MNKLREPSTTSTNEVGLIELPKDSVLVTGFSFIDLSIMSDVFSLLAFINCSKTNTLELLDIEDKKKRLARFTQLNVETVK